MYLYLTISSNIGIYVIYLGIRVLHWDTCKCIGIYDSASRHDRVISSHLPHGPLRVVLLTQLDIVLTLVHFYSLLGPHVRDFYTFEETIIVCWSSCKWLCWPLGDVALTTLIFLRNAHTKVATGDTYHWILSWMSHTCKGHITSWKLVVSCLDYSLAFGSWLEDHLGQWTIFDSPFTPWLGIGTFFEGCISPRPL
jgi:hypothetical protein